MRNKILMKKFIILFALFGTFSMSGHARDPFIGEIMLVPYSFCPRGWAETNGQLLSISQYSALFSLLGTTYGGNGRTNFGLPDLRGRVAVGQGLGPGLRSRNLGQRGGKEKKIY